MNEAKYPTGQVVYLFLLICTLFMLGEVFLEEANAQGAFCCGSASSGCLCRITWRDQWMDPGCTTSTCCEDIWECEDGVMICNWCCVANDCGTAGCQDRCI